MEPSPGLSFLAQPGGPAPPADQNRQAPARGPWRAPGPSPRSARTLPGSCSQVASSKNSSGRTKSGWWERACLKFLAIARRARVPASAWAARSLASFPVTSAPFDRPLVPGSLQIPVDRRNTIYTFEVSGLQATRAHTNCLQQPRQTATPTKRVRSPPTLGDSHSVMPTGQAKRLCLGHT